MIGIGVYKLPCVKFAAAHVAADRLDRVSKERTWLPADARQVRAGRRMAHFQRHRGTWSIQRRGDISIICTIKESSVSK